MFFFQGAWFWLACLLLFGRELAGQVSPSSATEYNPVKPAAAGAHLNSDPALGKTDALILSGDIAQAEQTVREYLKLHQRSATAHFTLGYVLFRETKAAASLAEYTEGAKFSRPSAYDLKIVACDYVLLNDFADADKWFTKAADWDPKDVQTWYYLGRAKYNENRFEEAIGAFKQALKLDPRNVKAADNLGLSYAGLSRTDDAMSAYRDAIAWQSDATVKNAQPYLNLGTLLVENDRPEDALPYLQGAMKISPLDPKVHKELGTAYMHLNQFDRAQLALEKAIECAPKDAALHYMLSQAYRRQGLIEKAGRENGQFNALKGDVGSSVKQPE